MMRSLSFRWPFGLGQSRATPLGPPTKAARSLPTPIVRWVDFEHSIGVRAFDWQADSETICTWQRETYAINFPDFTFTTEFALAFRHDLRRAMLDDNNGLYVLDEPTNGLCGFLWVVLCTNSWTGERYGYVNNLYITSEKRGMHLGEELIEQAQIWFRQRKVTKLRLTVTQSNASAVRLYERAGFRVERLEMEKDI